MMNTPTSGRHPARVLVLMRHAEAAHPGGTRDRDRPLTDHGRDQARATGRWLAAGGWSPDSALVSDSTRTRETLADTGLLTVDLRVETTAALWEATPDEVLEAIHETSSMTACLLVVGHAPSIPGLARELAGPTASPASVRLGERFPTAAAAVFAVDSDWADLGRNAERPGAALVDLFFADH